MKALGAKIAKKRKDIGMTQTDFADKLNVTRQTVSRWEAGTVLPDIDKIPDIAAILNVSCDYLMKDDVLEEESVTANPVSRLLEETAGKTVRFTFFEDEADWDLFNNDCRILEFQNNWIKVEAVTKKGKIEKLNIIGDAVNVARIPNAIEAGYTLAAGI